MPLETMITVTWADTGGSFEIAMMLDLFYNDNDGWYKSGTNETIREVSLTLVKAGVEEEVVHDCISEIISAIKGEYGD